MVYVISINNKPLMPCTPAKARILLKQNKAIVKELKPFTIQLTYKTKTEYTQEITLGVDSGYNNVGFSAITNDKELLVGEIKLLQGMKERLSERAMYRKQRRSRLRYRKPRWNNRIKSKPKGWLAPSLQHKLDSHIKFINYLYSILPITKCIVEIANFDIQKIKNPDIQGEEYQQGEQLGFWNLREYILHRDNHKCQNPNCKNKSKNPILEVHHIKYKSLGGQDSPSNMITLCNKCHTSPNHKKGRFLYDWCQEDKKVRGFKDATFMSMIRWYLVNQLKEKYNNVSFTYGYITKNHRITNNIEKSHCNDAFCIAKGINQIRNNEVWNITQVRRNNRSLEKFYDAKYIDIRNGKKVSGSELNNGRRSRNKNYNTKNLHEYRGQKVSRGQRRIRKDKYFYQPNDLVKYEGRIYTVKGTQNKGKYVALKEVKKVPKVELLASYKFNNGFVWS
ncbi:RNA-guided endonuclease IscB [Clostridium sporogenes]|uniref:RNA-guided endonuclease IscB n=1 Tax=Clostridium sporogenes TaxID=1509 RepID=UPI0013D76CCE|nr:RNA-guided endonuclease IscB [Clostridium sporogenes]NFH40754.1 paclitaxel/taxanoid biosynthesis susceptibility protein TS1 [Clostridium sporogenes]